MTDPIDLFNQRKRMIAFLCAEIPGSQELKALVAMEAYAMLLDGHSMCRVLAYIDNHKLEKAA
jgi:hypothetical protein